MHVRVVGTDLRTRIVRPRIPFDSGGQLLDEVLLAELSMDIQTSEGTRCTGRASDLLVPNWFERGDSTSYEEEAQALTRSAGQAADIATLLGQTAGAHPVFELWSVVHSEHVGARIHRDPDALVRGFGVALVERAMIDATCRAAGCSLDRALRSGLLGFSPRRLAGEAAAWTPDRLPASRTEIEVRHTVGVQDPLTEVELSGNGRNEDGLPESLQENVRRYGLRRFKIKLSGELDLDAGRLRDVARIIAGEAVVDARFTLDGDERYRDLDALAGLLEDLGTDPVARGLIERLELIAQPLPRSETFDTEANRPLGRLGRVAPVIIDEADTDPDAFRQAIALGYAGVGIKACKGVFRAVANRALIDVRRDRGEGSLFQSGEDLCNLGATPLQQDLALQAALGMIDVERNGHHRFRGLDHLPADAGKALAERLPHLYVREQGCTRVRIERGLLDLREVVDGPGFGGFPGP